MCDPTDRKRPEQAKPETAIGLVVAKAAGGLKKGSEQAGRAVGFRKLLNCAVIMSGFKV